MASIIKITTPVICRIQRRNSRNSLLPQYSIPAVRFHLPTANLRIAAPSATSSSVVMDTTPEYISTVEESDTVKNILGCPVCYVPLTWSGDSSISIETIPDTTLQCNTCKKSYFAKKSNFDLVINSGSKDYVESMPPVTQFFSTPAMSFIYERGWRQNFGLGGYPGPNREFEMAKEYFRPVLGGNIVDASCGSGLFSRRFAKSGLFSLVVALDYSEAMLQQCLEFLKEDPDFPKEKLTLVRADISRLPIVSGTIDAVHAGAALHCWPSPSSAGTGKHSTILNWQGNKLMARWCLSRWGRSDVKVTLWVAEISRVLRPGGVFVATTTIADGPFSLVQFRSIFREFLQQYSGSRVFLSERELRDLCTTCGLVDFRCTRNGLFVMISATKPS